MIKCYICNKELNENEFSLKDCKLFMCNSCFLNVETEFKERRREENICPVCDMENCKKRERDYPVEMEFEEVKKSEFSILKNSVNQIKECNEKLEDNEKQKEILKAIINNIKEDIKLIYNINEEKLDETKEFIFVPESSTRIQRIDRLNKGISSEFSNLRHSIKQIECHVPRFEINENLSAITKNINKLVYYLYYKTHQESIGLTYKRI